MSSGVKIRIRCASCGFEYYAYSISDTENARAFNCPRCFAEMDETMREQVIQVMLHVHDLNHHFVKYHLERQEPLFEVSFEPIVHPDHMPKRSGRSG